MQPLESIKNLGRRELQNLGRKDHEVTGDVG